jgi:hypothetical protein
MTTTFSPLARDLLVGLRDMNDLRDARKGLDPRRIDAPIISNETHGRALCTGHRAGLVTHFLDNADYAIDVFRRRVVRHDY